MNLPRPWCTVAQAADYTQFHERQITRMMVPENQGHVQGKIRFRKVEPQKSVRLHSADVFAILPEPEDI